MSLTRAEQIQGCLLGGALGDSIGAIFEQSPLKNDFTIPNTLRVTDDTQLTIATCESIIEIERVDPENIAGHFVRWFRENRLVGLGASTLKALTELNAGGHWALVGAVGEQAAGNGAAMRIAPLAFFLDADIDSDRRIVRDVCRITHRHDEAYIGALAIHRLARSVVSGDYLDWNLLRITTEALPDSQTRDRLRIVCQAKMSFRDYITQFSASGHVVDSVPLAMLMAIEASDIMDGILQLSRCDGDSDTIASIFGQLYGAAYGRDRLPMEIIGRIEAAQHIGETAIKLSLVSNTTN